MSLIQKIIVRVGLSVIIFLAIYAHFILPKYPKIDHNQPYQYVFEDVAKQITSNSQSINLEYIHDQKRKEQYKESIQKLKVDLENCDKNKDSKCLVSSYENFMDDNVASSKRIFYKSLYVHDTYGRLGDLIITENYKWLF